MQQTPRNSNLENLAEPCFDYLISDPEELGRFMDFAGYDGETLRGSVGSSALWHALIDYFAQSESALVAMCNQAGRTPERFMREWQKINAVA